jgi:hypothetical protein
MKTCTECGWVGERTDSDGSCPNCNMVGYIQSEVELHLRLYGEWECLITVNCPARFARAVQRGDYDYDTGALSVGELARLISSAFGVSVKVVSGGQDVIIDEIC